VCSRSYIFLAFIRIYFIKVIISNNILATEFIPSTVFGCMHFPTAQRTAVGPGRLTHNMATPSAGPGMVPRPAREREKKKKEEEIHSETRSAVLRQR
jgi:hypothetical protein